MQFCFLLVVGLLSFTEQNKISSARRQKGLTGYNFYVYR